MPRIDGDRLLADLRRIADFGRYETGVHRPHLSPQDVESRHWLAGRMKEAGLEPVIDGVGNVIGRSPKSGPRLLIGSHTDTQPRGGWLDGVMGVIYGLEVARAFRADPRQRISPSTSPPGPTRRAIGASMTRQPLLHRQLSEEDIDVARHRDDGTPMREALPPPASRGAAPPSRGWPVPWLSRGAYRAGRRAGGAGLRIGIVTAIVGIWQYRWSSPASRTMPARRRCRRRDAGVAHDAALCHDRRFPAVAARAACGPSARCRSNRARRRSSRPRRDAIPVPRRRPAVLDRLGGNAARDRRSANRTAPAPSSA
jgi:beta-ureidopropionase / N-carbamoyl-L-amino-acid hydrolase